MPALAVVRQVIYAVSVEHMQTRNLSAVAAGNVRAWREEQGWSQTRLAEAVQALGVSMNRSIVANIESGRRDQITLEELAGFAQALNVSPLALLLNSTGTVAPTPASPAPAHRVGRWLQGEDSLLDVRKGFDPSVEAEQRFHRKLTPEQLRERRAATYPAVMATRSAGRIAATVCEEVETREQTGEWGMSASIVVHELDRLRRWLPVLHSELSDLIDRAARMLAADEGAAAPTGD